MGWSSEYYRTWSSHLPLSWALKSNDVLPHCRGWCWGDTGMHTSGLHYTLARPSEGEVGHYWQEVPRWSHLAQQGAIPASTPLQCQPAQSETSVTTQAAAERFSEKVAAKGANITSSLQPPWMALPVQHRGCFEWQGTGSESSYNHCWCVPAYVSSSFPLGQVTIWVWLTTTTTQVSPSAGWRGQWTELIECALTVSPMIREGQQGWVSFPCSPWWHRGFPQIT